MSVGSNLQEMENVVTKGAAAAEPMQGLMGGTPGQPAVEDLGGPTPENYRVDDDSAKLKEPTLSTVKDVVNKAAAAAEPMASLAKEEEEVEGEVVSEEEVTEEETQEEIVAEEETSETEVVSEEEEVVEDVIDVEEDVNALLAGEELSEEFQEKARTIFESAIKAKVAEMKEEVQKQYEASLEEEVIAVKEELTSRIDAYLEYVADEWMTQNQIAVEKGLKTEMTESFLTGMKSLFEEHYVSIPEEKYDVLNSMVEKLDEMESKLNEQIEKNVSLNKRLAESVADGIFDEIAEGLALSQKEKLASLAESVEFGSENEYREKLVALKESYFPSKTAAQTKTETLTEGTDVAAEVVSPAITSYAQMLTRMSKS